MVEKQLLHAVLLNVQLSDMPVRGSTVRQLRHTCAYILRAIHTKDNNYNDNSNDEGRSHYNDNYKKSGERFHTMLAKMYSYV